MQPTLPKFKTAKLNNKWTRKKLNLYKANTFKIYNRQKKYQTDEEQFKPFLKPPRFTIGRLNNKFRGEKSKERDQIKLRLRPNQSAAPPSALESSYSIFLFFLAGSSRASSGLGRPFCSSSCCCCCCNPIM